MEKNYSSSLLLPLLDTPPLTWNKREIREVMTPYEVVRV